MVFKINVETFQIEGRKGDSGAFKFIFDRELEGFDVYFMVKAGINDKDEKALIRKKFESPQGNSVVVEILPDDTSDLRTIFTKRKPFIDYFWGLKVVKDEDFAQTVIPKGEETAPKFRVYPQIIEGEENEQ